MVEIASFLLLASMSEAADTGVEFTTGVGEIARIPPIASTVPHHVSTCLGFIDDKRGRGALGMAGSYDWLGMAGSYDWLELHIHFFVGNHLNRKYDN